MGLFDHCFGDAATHQCQAWYQDIPLITGRALPGRSGYGIVLQMQTIQHVIMNRSQEAEGVSLLQRHARLLRSIPVTDEVGEIAAPDENLSDVEARVINLIPGAPMDPLPGRIEIFKDGGQKELEAELLTWGHSGKAIIFDEHDKAVCFPPGWRFNEDVHYMFCHSDVMDVNGAFLHSCGSALSEIDQLRLLHRCGYLRASLTLASKFFPACTRSTLLINKLRKAKRPCATSLPLNGLNLNKDLVRLKYPSNLVRPSPLINFFVPVYPNRTFKTFSSPTTMSCTMTPAALISQRK